MKELNAILEKAPTYNGPVYRGLGLKTDSADWAALKTQLESGNKMLSFTNTQSFTAKHDIVEQFMGQSKVRVEFQIKKAPRRSALVRDFSAHKFEEEVIVGPGSKYRIIEIERHKYWNPRAIGQAKRTWYESIRVELEEII